MHFLQARINDVLERSSLKVAVLCLSVVSLIFALMLALDLSREPLLIERACETQIARAASSAQTESEVEAFLREAISVRFDTSADRDPASFLTQDQVSARAKEREELKRGGIDQRMIVRAVKSEGDHFVISADRLVAVDKARSAIPLLLVAKVASKTRSLTNPYGLLLTSVEQQKEAKND